MKARVIATGKIVEVAYHGLGVYVDMNQWDKEYQFDEIVVLDNGDPDYWTRLEHQYAGMAMQGIMSNQEYVHSLVQRVAGGEIPNLAEGITKHAEQLAHALVEKYKKEEKK